MPIQRNVRKPKKDEKPAKARQLRELSAVEFENLIFDLVVSRGAHGVTWRTPGADGGRDIECVVAHRDFSGAQLAQKWFVECKRYSRSIDWPTIYEKLSYADSHEADVLLICTTATFSVNATTRVEEWNAKRRHPIIRLWPRHEIELQLAVHPDLRLKYGLALAKNMPGKSMMTLALALSKSVSSHYSRLIFRPGAIDPMLEAAQAFADLLLRRIDDIERYGEVRALESFQLSSSLREFVALDRIVTLDEYGLRAFVMYLAALAADKVVIEAPSEHRCVISSPGKIGEIVQRYLHVFSAIAMWSNFDFTIAEKAVQIEQRKAI